MQYIYSNNSVRASVRSAFVLELLQTAVHKFIILGECVLLMSGVVLSYFFAVRHPPGVPQGVLVPLGAPCTERNPRRICIALGNFMRRDPKIAKYFFVLPKRS